MIKQTTNTEEQQEYVHFALAKLYDKLGRNDDAFSHYQQANDRFPGNLSETEYAATMGAVTRTFDWSFISLVPRAAIKTQCLVFILGMPRSGTSLAEKILARHESDLCCG